MLKLQCLGRVPRNQLRRKKGYHAVNDDALHVAAGQVVIDVGYDLYGCALWHHPVSEFFGKYSKASVTLRVKE